VDDTVKALRINGVAPTFANVDNDSYELFRSFWFISAAEPAGAARNFVNYVLSDEGKRILAAEGLVPVR
jgi:phosphate transport system substrate-binding protein